MQRRTFITTVGAAAAVGMAGCSGSDTETEAEGTEGEGTESMENGTESMENGTESMGTEEMGTEESTEEMEEMGGDIDVEYESPADPQSTVEAWYGLQNWSGGDVESLVDAQNTLLHTESRLYPLEVGTPTGEEGEGTPADVDVQFDGLEFGEIAAVEDPQTDAPSLNAQLDEDVMTTLVEEGELTKVPTTPQYSGDDAPPSQEVPHFVAKEDGEWRFLQ